MKSKWVALETNLCSISCVIFLHYGASFHSEVGLTQEYPIVDMGLLFWMALTFLKRQSLMTNLSCWQK